MIVYVCNNNINVLNSNMKLLVLWIEHPAGAEWWL